MKYYKILRNDLTHHGYQYHEGLNVDPNEWVSGECEPGGFYFTTSKYILDFFGYGNLICDIEIPKGAMVESYGNKAKSNQILISNIRELWTVETMQELLGLGVEKDSLFIKAVKKGKAKSVKFLLKSEADVHTKREHAICLAAGSGREDIVKLLLENGANIHTCCGSYAIYWAAINGHKKIIQMLLKAGADVHVDHDAPLCTAAEYGYTEIVKILIDAGADIHTLGDYPLQLSCRMGKYATVKLLLEHGANVHASENWAFQLAKEYGHTEIVELLKQYS